MDDVRFEDEGVITCPTENVFKRPKLNLLLQLSLTFPVIFLYFEKN